VRGGGRRTRATARRALAALVIALPLGCSSRAPGASAAVIYGDDDRVEALAASSDVIRARALRSTVAVLTRLDTVRLCDPRDVRWETSTLGERERLCETEAFRDQPVIAGCSATLIDDDLVLTAQHCIGDDERCRDTRLVLGLYLEADGSLRTIDRSDVYACARRVAVPVDRDLVIVELDRPVSSPAFEPAPLGAAPPQVGDRLAVPGFPTGIPMKVAEDCAILSYYEAGDDYRMNCDLLPGGSGSGVLDETGAVIGVYAVGGGGYRRRGDCYVDIELAEDGTPPDLGGVPQLGAFEPVGPIRDLLCAAGIAARVCGLEPVCGDLQCTGRETWESCAADCAPPRCGDAVCDLDEDYDCPVDCGARDRSIECPSLDAGSSLLDSGIAEPSPRDSGGPVSPLDAARSRSTDRRAVSWVCALGSPGTTPRGRAAPTDRAAIATLAALLLAGITGRSRRRARREPPPRRARLPS
jgi:hypothetical protein